MVPNALARVPEMQDTPQENNSLLTIRDILAYNKDGWRASSLRCGWHLKSEIDAVLWDGALADNRKIRN